MKIINDRQEIINIRTKCRIERKKVVFTNGCFDILHAGHVDYLIKAKEKGDVLIVALNSDKSIKHIKDSGRPIIPENERAFILANLKPVDYVTFFDEDTPLKIINDLVPDVLIKGADWNLDKIVGRDIVEANGGKVETIEFVNNQSTSKIIETILERYKNRI